MPITNIAQAIKATEQEFLKEAKILQPKMQKIANENVKQAVLDLQVYDTGYLYRHTFCLVSVLNKYIEFSFRTVDTPYSIYPYYGWGTSARYGARKYLELASRRTLGR
jgi:hypothetical protein